MKGVEFMLADMATELMAAKTLMYRIAWEIDAGLDRKMAHGRVSALKLFSSEVAGGWSIRRCRYWAVEVACARIRWSVCIGIYA